jgi:hypothetical protein
MPPQSHPLLNDGPPKADPRCTELHSPPHRFHDHLSLVLIFSYLLSHTQTLGSCLSSQVLLILYIFFPRLLLSTSIPCLRGKAKEELPGMRPGEGRCPPLTFLLKPVESPSYLMSKLLPLHNHSVRPPLTSPHSRTPMPTELSGLKPLAILWVLHHLPLPLLTNHHLHPLPLDTPPPPSLPFFP